MAFSLFVYIMLKSVALDLFLQLKPLPIHLLITLITVPNLFLDFVYLSLPLHKQEVVMDLKYYVENNLFEM